MNAPRSPSARSRDEAASLLVFLDEARRQLGADLLRHNPRGDLRRATTLNAAVQRIVTRLAFLCAVEFRGVTTDLASAVRRDGAASGTYRRLIARHRALFEPHPSDDLVMSNAWLAEFVGALRNGHPEGVSRGLGAETLGEAYERALAHPLVVNRGSVRLRSNPRVRKAAGVFYTPPHLTGYIVGQTLGRFLGERSASEGALLRVLDPACGAGAFLLCAYERLLQHHRQHLRSHPCEQSQGSCAHDKAGNLQLTFALKRRLLRDHIHGVDIDPQAVEMTRLALLLKLLEGESAGSLRLVRGLGRGEPLLPALDENIRCFNALVGSDISADARTRARVRAADWNERFPAALAAGGFDVVLGNPPYVFGEFVSPTLKRYLRRRYVTARGQMDLYHLFLEQSLRLTKPGGFHGYIVPDAILARHETAALRRTLLERHRLIALAHPGEAFPGAGVSTAIVCTQAHVAGTRRVPLHRIATDRPVVVQRRLDPRRFLEDPLTRFTLGADDAAHRILRKLRACPALLGNCCAFSRGEEIGKKRFSRTTQLATEHEWIRVGADVHRYHVAAPQFQIPRSEVRKARSRYVGPKLLLVKTGARPHAALDTTDTVTMQSLYQVHTTGTTDDLRVFLAVINSRLIAWYLRQTVTAAKKLFPQFNQGHFESLPLPTFPLKTRRQLAAQVEKLGRLATARAAAASDGERATLDYARAAIERDVDRIIYAAYGVTAGEIATIEAAPL